MEYGQLQGRLPSRATEKGPCTAQPRARPPLGPKCTRLHSATLRPSAHLRALLNSSLHVCAAHAFTAAWPKPSRTARTRARWRIALAPGFVGPLGCIASLQHARSPDYSRVFSLSLKHAHAVHASQEEHGPRPLLPTASAEGAQEGGAGPGRQRQQHHLRAAQRTRGAPQYGVAATCPRPAATTAPHPSSQEPARPAHRQARPPPRGRHPTAAAPADVSRAARLEQQTALR
jgi:hypothetical protein